MKKFLERKSKGVGRFVNLDTKKIIAMGDLPIETLQKVFPAELLGLAWEGMQSFAAKGMTGSESSLVCAIRGYVSIKASREVYKELRPSYREVREQGADYNVTRKVAICDTCLQDKMNGGEDCEESTFLDFMTNGEDIQEDYVREEKIYKIKEICNKYPNVVKSKDTTKKGIVTGSKYVFVKCTKLEKEEFVKELMSI